MLHNCGIALHNSHVYKRLLRCSLRGKEDSDGYLFFLSLVLCRHPFKVNHDLNGGPFVIFEQRLDEIELWKK